MIKINSLLVGVYLLLMALALPLWSGYLIFCVGGLLGLGLLIADEHYFYKLYQEELSEEVRFCELISRSPLFWLSLVPLSIFVITSAGSFLVEGLVLGMMVGLVGEMWQLKNIPQLFIKRFLTGVKLEQTGFDPRPLIWGATGYFLLINLLFLI
ncbi:MAG: hypothetical protein GF381_03615 [Candidatus Pacebacteria bacterium]|nr:hypothetical protein [Candidatus Paceibacterota bacterium]